MLLADDISKRGKGSRITSLDLKILRAAQDGICAVPSPYLELGDRLGLPEELVIEHLSLLLEQGVIRRFAATIGHIALGIVANAMIVWRVPPDRVADVGEILASFPEVTHCYERQSAPAWPYNLYTMVHSRSREECLRIASDMSARCGVEDFRVLFSEREYKKTSARI